MSESTNSGTLLSGLCRSLLKPKNTRSQQTWRPLMTEQSQHFSSSYFRGGRWRSKHKGLARSTHGGKWVRVVLTFTLKRSAIVVFYLFSLFILILFFFSFSLFDSARIVQEKFDASLMHVMPEVAAQERLVDNGTGQVEVPDSLGFLDCEEPFRDGTSVLGFADVLLNTRRLKINPDKKVSVTSVVGITWSWQLLIFCT